MPVVCLLEENRRRREEEGGKKKTMPLREMKGAQTYAQTGQAKNHTDPHDPQMNRASLQRGSILTDRSYKP
ncbi:hypothetical protein MTR_3g090080 [Medicago truncatula]|uniref:Uncharacterized protein n=1 Tax=Medicago truncatula TaxID=3880 RepID=G7J651_MEDTR|nr:hypothetical protein MTR_3g090080 [Medicago truncatula]